MVKRCAGLKGLFESLSALPDWLLEDEKSCFDSIMTNSMFVQQHSLVTSCATIEQKVFRYLFADFLRINLLSNSEPTVTLFILLNKALIKNNACRAMAQIEEISPSKHHDYCSDRQE